MSTLSFLGIAAAAIGLLSAKKSSSKMTPLPSYPEMSAEAQAQMKKSWEANDYMLDKSFSDLTGFDINEYQKIEKVKQAATGVADVQEQTKYQMAKDIISKMGYPQPISTVMGWINSGGSEDPSINKLVGEAMGNKYTVNIPGGKTASFSVAETKDNEKFMQSYFEGVSTQYGMTSSEMISEMSNIGLWNKNSGKFYPTVSDAIKDGNEPKTIQAYFSEQLDAVNDGDLNRVAEITNAIKDSPTFKPYYDKYYDPVKGEFEKPNSTLMGMAGDILIKYKDVKNPDGSSVLPENVQKISEVLQQQPEKLNQMMNAATAKVNEGVDTINKAKTGLESLVGDNAATFDKAGRNAQSAMQYASTQEDVKNKMAGDNPALDAQTSGAMNSAGFDPASTGKNAVANDAMSQLQGKTGEKVNPDGSAIKDSAVGTLMGQKDAQGNQFATEGMIQSIDASRAAAQKNIEDAYMQQSNKLEETLAARGIVNSSQANLEREKLKKEALAGPMAQLATETENQKQQLIFDAQAKDVNKRTEVAGALAAQGTQDIQTGIDTQKFNITNSNDLLKLLVDSGLSAEATLLSADKAKLDATVQRLNALSQSGKDIRESISTELGLSNDQATQVLNTAKTMADVQGTQADATVKTGSAIGDLGGKTVEAGTALSKIGETQNAGINQTADSTIKVGAMESETKNLNVGNELKLVGMDNENLSGAMQTAANLYGVEAGVNNNQYTAQANSVNQQNANKTAQANAVGGALSSLVGALTSKSPAKPNTSPAPVATPTVSAKPLQTQSGMSSASGNAPQQPLNAPSRPAQAPANPIPYPEPTKPSNGLMSAAGGTIPAPNPTTGEGSFNQPTDPNRPRRPSNYQSYPPVLFNKFFCFLQIIVLNFNFSRHKSIYHSQQLVTKKERPLRPPKFKFLVTIQVTLIIACTEKRHTNREHVNED